MIEYKKIYSLKLRKYIYLKIESFDDSSKDTIEIINKAEYKPKGQLS